MADPPDGNGGELRGCASCVATIQDEFNRWATQSSANLLSPLELAGLYEALGECEAELIHELVAYVDDQGNIVYLGPPMKGGGTKHADLRGTAVGSY